MADEIVIADSITELSRDDWSSLTENDVYGQYGWLRTVETAIRDASQPKYFFLYRDGNPLVAAALYGHTRRDMSGRLGDLLFGRAAEVIRKLRLAPGRTMYCGPLIGQGRHVFWNKQYGPEHASISIRAMLEVLNNQFTVDKVPVVFGRTPEDEPDLLRELRDFGCIESCTWPISYIDLKWDSFDDYVKSLSGVSKNMSTKARREISAPAKRGVRIQSLSTFSSNAEKIDRLFLQNQSKHATEPPAFERSFVDSLAEYNSGQSVMNIAETDDGSQFLGCALLLRAGTSAAGPLIGVENDNLNRKAFTYFNLSLYTPVRYCLQHNISRLYLGSGLARMKQKRGCGQMNVYVFALAAPVFPRLAWRCWMWLHRRWITMKLTRESV